MPFSVEKSSKCGDDKPYAVVTSATGKLHGCHESRKSALKQIAALYANEPSAKKK